MRQKKKKKPQYRLSTPQSGWQLLLKEMIQLCHQMIWMGKFIVQKKRHKDGQEEKTASPPAALGARFRFCSRLKADPVFKASSRLSMTPSWSSGALKSTSAFFLAARSARSRSCFSLASLARACFSVASLSLTMSE